MSDYTKMVRINGWGLVLEGDDEATIEDVELAAKLGFTRERDVRKLVERLQREGLLSDVECRATVARHPLGNRGGFQEVKTYRLTEAGALLVIARSETKVAQTILRQVIDVYIAYRRGQITKVEPVLATGVRVADNALACAGMAGWCTMASKTLGLSIRRVHGAVRRHFLVPGVYHVPLALWPVAQKFLEDLSMRRLVLPELRALGAAPTTQLGLFVRTPKGQA